MAASAEDATRIIGHFNYEVGGGPDARMPQRELSRASSCGRLLPDMVGPQMNRSGPSE
jgi:hypothetical protein